MLKQGVMEVLPKVRGVYKINEPLCRHTWFAVGGPAEVMFVPCDEADLGAFLQGCPAEVPLFVIGGGSNLLVRDGGIDGVVIKLEAPAFKKIELNGNILTCGAGLRNVELQKFLVKNGIGGLEFLSTIPGTIGGSVRTNAGCYGKEVKDVLKAARVVNRKGELSEVSADELHLTYRNSSFPEDWIITALDFEIQEEEPEKVLETLNHQKMQREASQPHNVKTAGSTFKNPEGQKAWALIKQAGCAELAVGGAKVSERHANFLVNADGACARDIENLGEEIVRRVYENSGIKLEWEVKRVGKP